MKILIPIMENEIKNVETPYGRSLYEINRKTILQHICEQYVHIKETEIIFILHANDIEKYHLYNVVKLIVPTARIVAVKGHTSGSACSCMLALDYLDEDEPIIVVGGDQLVTMNLQEVVNKFVEEDYDGGLVCFKDIHPRWSYVALDDDGFVIEAAEKNPISNNAGTGFYYFKKVGDFANAIFRMIMKKACINGKYYICPAYNELILRQKRIGVYFIEKEQYFNFSHPKGIELYEEYLRGKEHEDSKTF